MNSEIQVDNKKQKSKYSTWQNSWYMIRHAIKDKEKKVLVNCTLIAVLTVAIYVLNLYFPPVVLENIQNKVGLSTFVKTIGVFVFGLIICEGIKTYIETNALYGKVTVRLLLLKLQTKKLITTSYPHIEDEDYMGLNMKGFRALGNNHEAGEAIWITLTNLLQNLLGLIIYLLIMTKVNVVLIFIVVITSILGYIVNIRLSGYEYANKEEYNQINKETSYIGYKGKDYTVAKDIRIFGMKPWLDEINDKAIRAGEAFTKKVENRYFIGRILDLCLSILRSGIAYVYLIAQVLDNNMSIAEFLLYFSVIGGFTTWLLGILNNMTTLQRQCIDIDILRSAIEKEELFKFEDGESLVPKKNQPYELKLDNISFSYNGKDMLYKDFSLTVPHGEKLAIVGLNGAGKTTLIKLLCGFYEPCQGSVNLNGVNINKYNRRDYYSMFSAIFQTSDVLATTIAANVASNEDDIDMDLVKHCINLVGLKEKVESLPQKYETRLNRHVFSDGVMLSGGETQRLLIARALYKDAPIVVLDEPTAALDPIAEEELYMKYNEITEGRTAIYISHRLSSTRFCDRIILVENGKIIEEGTHNQLIAKNGKYKELFDIQSKYYQEVEA